MKTHSRIITCLFLCVAAPVFAAESSTPEAKSPLGFIFQKTEFSLGFVNSNALFIINEYAAKGESVDDWTQLFTIGYYPKGSALAQITATVVQAAKPYLVAPAQFITRPGVSNENDIEIFLMQFDKSKQLYEFDLQRYTHEEGVVGVKFYQYGKHYKSPTDFPKAVEVNNWIDALWQAKVPIVDKSTNAQSASTVVPSATSSPPKSSGPK